MKKTQNVFLYSLTSLAVMASAVASANEAVYVPELEGGLTASVGAWIATPSSSQSAPIARPSEDSVEVLNVTPGYDVGIEASLGYIFEDTANGIELFFRNFDTNDTSDFTAYNPIAEENTSVTQNLGYELTAFDLMISQFMNIGQHMQMRFAAGAAYVDLQQQDSGTIYNVDGLDKGNDLFVQQSSNYKGWGPRLAIDARYDFGGEIEGFGIVAGGSVAYFLGDLDSQTPAFQGESIEIVSNEVDSQAVTNLRGNAGVDYVYFFNNDEGSTLGLEVGYQVDYYDDAIGVSLDNFSSAVTATEPLTFSGPYVQLKGVF